MKTEKNNLLEFEEQKALYDKFSVDTLESLDTLYYYVLEEKTPMSFNIIYQKKYEENADNYNGREEMTENIYLDNFDITEINNTLKDLSDQELAFISKPIYKAISNIDPCDPESKIGNKLKEFDKVFQQEIKKRFTPIYEGMLLKDVKNFFYKFSLAALENFDRILDYTGHERLDEIKRVKEEAYKSKKKKYTNNVVTTISDVLDFEYYKFAGKIEELTDLELDFFHSLVNDASTYFNCLEEHSDYYKESIKDFNINNYPIKEMEELLKLIEQEQTIDRSLRLAPATAEDEAKEKTK